jgi:3-dehydroquinate synthase
MRGVAFGLVPTTLLAQADAAVGGKNGVNVGGYKNIAGTFGEPEFVLCDADFLTTLPARELRSGLAEVVKAAVIGDPELFAMLEGGDFTLGEVVRRAVAVKVSIVSRDRHENNERRLLNLGHTIGHAIEVATATPKYLVNARMRAEGSGTSSETPLYSHGEAVSIGIAAAAGVAVRLGVLEPAAAARIVALLESLGLPTTADIDPARLVAAMRADKKNYADGLRFVLPTAIGSCTVRTLRPEEIII